jgi:DNA-binding NarL/FixJ family response regulator
MTKHQKSIYIIEDQDIIRNGIVGLLSQSGWFETVLSFSSGEDIVAQIPTLNPANIILVDIGLPGIDGIETMKFLLDVWPASRFLIFTIYEDDTHVFDALKYGASGYILKSESPENILASIRDVIDGGAPMSRGIANKIISSFRVKEKAGHMNQLTARENELLKFLAEGYLNKEIADKLSVTLSTVKNHLQNIYLKLHVQNRSEAIIKYFNRK